MGGKKIFKKNDSGPPKDPTEKFRLRLLIGRKTGRLDLACKEFWPNGHSQHPSRTATQPGSPTKPSRRYSSMEGEIVTIDENEVLEEGQGSQAAEETSHEEGHSVHEEDLAPLFAEVLSGDHQPATDGESNDQTKPPPSVSGKADIEFRLFKVPSDVFRFSGVECRIKIP